MKGKEGKEGTYISDDDHGDIHEQENRSRRRSWSISRRGEERSRSIDTALWPVSLELLVLGVTR
jgi:hypothetical protein